MADKKPAWLVQKISNVDNINDLWGMLNKLKIHTVCQSAHCPNLVECFGQRTATFLILGGTCTRNCRFCAVTTGQPEELDLAEPQKITEVVKMLKLKHCVITSVTRDDLVDGGAGQFAACVKEVRIQCPGTIIEVLVPDFRGDEAALATVLETQPDIFNHNIETIPKLYSVVRPQANYLRSLKVLETAAKSVCLTVKSGLMLGLGETMDEVVQVLRDLRSAGVSVVTMGQYMQPTPDHLKVAEYVHPEKFQLLKKKAYALGFKHVAAGPLVRSSYRAEEIASASGLYSW